MLFELTGGFQSPMHQHGVVVLVSLKKKKKTENTVRPSAVGDSSDKSKTANPEKYESK